MRLNFTKKNIGLINSLLQLKLSELFRTLTQASRSLLLLKGWQIEERPPFIGSTYETWFEPFSLKVYPYDSKRLRWTKKPLTSVQGMNPLQTWAKNFQLSASFKTTNPLSICWKGKRYVRRCCEKKQRSAFKTIPLLAWSRSHLANNHRRTVKPRWILPFF